MADNVTLNPMTGGDTAAADEISSGVAAGAKVQRVKAGWGADGVYNDAQAAAPIPVQLGDGTTLASVATGDSGQTAQLVAGTRKEVAFSTTTVQAVASTEVSNYRWVSVHITGQGTGSVVGFQASNDNVNWANCALVTTTSTAGPAVSSTTANGVMLHGPLPGRYFRLNVTGIVGGTTAGVVEFFSSPTAVQGIGVDTELPNAAAIADGAGNPTAPAVAGALQGYNGSAWDRLRTVSAISDAALSTGLLAAGLIGWDNPNSLYRRVRADANGSLLTRAGGGLTSTVTSVAASVTSVPLLTPRTTRAQALFYNDSTATLYLKVGATASTSSFTVKIAPGGYYELPAAGGVYTGAIDGIWDAAAGAVLVTEVG